MVTPTDDATASALAKSCQVWQEIVLPPPWEPQPFLLFQPEEYKHMSLAKKTRSGQLQHLQPGHCLWLSLALWPALGTLHDGAHPDHHGHDSSFSIHAEHDPLASSDSIGNAWWLSLP